MEYYYIPYTVYQSGNCMEFCEYFFLFHPMSFYGFLLSLFFSFFRQMFFAFASVSLLSFLPYS